MIKPITVLGAIIGAVVSYYLLNLLWHEKPLQDVQVTAELLPPVAKVKRVRSRHESSLSCLQKTIYFEAANQGDVGMTAVANVVMNRLQDYNFPDTVCEVTYQKVNMNGHTVCQFTWYCEGHHKIYHDSAWKRSKEIAEAALKGTIEHVVGNAKFYHAIYVLPSWAAQHTQVAQIGDHIFYE